ncbi:MAG: anti-sigma factor, partial [Pirellulales bacterium]
MAESDGNFDDELLSAYLDGELTAEERARVEERLSVDPASRQLLDELRSVSQAMQGLPHAKLSGDLRESVLRRAERSMLVAKDATAAGRPGADGFSLPFGRSKRAW